MTTKFDTIATATLSLCAILTTAIVVYRMFGTPSAGAHVVQQPVFIDDWRSHLGAGVRMGSESAPVQLIEFGDFECPFCAAYERTLNEVRQRYPTQVAVTFVHFPLAMHRFALPAARVVECAGEQGRFEAMHERLFDGQDGFGLKPWSEYATAAGVPDLPMFEACIGKTDSMPRVEAGRALGRKFDVQGTPTLVVNGWRLAAPASAEELDGMIKAILSGGSPVATGKRR